MYLMRTIACAAMGLVLASCTAAVEDGFRPASRSSEASRRPEAPRAARPARPSAPALAPVGAVVSSPTADPSTSILAYHDDLEACRRGASAGMGSGALDDVAALKRAIADGGGQGAGRAAGQAPIQGGVTVSYRSDDLAVRRDRAVKTCLSKRGYVLKD